MSGYRLQGRRPAGYVKQVAIAAGVILFCIGIAIAPSLLPFAAGAKNRPAPTERVATAQDPVTRCRIGVVLSRHDIVVFDLTDPLFESTWREARGKIAAIRDTLPPNGKLTVLRIDPERPYTPIEVFSRCSIGKPSGEDTWTATGSFEVRQWDNAFAKPLEDALAGLASIPAAEPSPIMETLTSLSWREDFRAEVKERNLLLVSDLAQHHPKGYSQLRQGASWKHYARSRQFAEARADLRGVKVRVLYVNRPLWRRLQNKDHVRLWERIFDRFGVKAAFIGAPELETPAAQLTTQKSVKPKRFRRPGEVVTLYY